MPRSPCFVPLRAVLLAVLVASVAAPHVVAQAPDITYERVGGTLWQVEGAARFEVDERVVSLAIAPGGPALADVLARLDALAPGATVLRRNGAGVVDLSLPAGTDALAAVAALAAGGGLRFAEPVTLGRYGGEPDDPQFAQQWALRNAGQQGGTPGADVGALAAWEITGGQPSVVVAVLDSGVDLDHPDLAANLWVHPGEIAANGVDDDGNGFVDDVRGWDFAGGDNDPEGLHYHGTAVAGVVAAVGDNGVGIAGLAGGGDGGAGCRVLPVAVGSFAPQSAVVDDAIVYAADLGARVISLSLSVGSSAAIEAAVDYAVGAGALVVCASGNGGATVSFPASLSQVLAVGSTDRHDAPSSFSNGGSALDLVAPGEAVVMTSLGGGYFTSSGTSFAAPLVSALAALLVGQVPALTPAGLRELLVETAVDLGNPGWDPLTGHGRIDARAALLLAGGPGVGSATPYGVGLAGTQGAVPVMSTPGGPPYLGNADFSIRLGQAAAGRPCWLLVGVAAASQPWKGGSLLVDLGSSHALLAQVVGGSAGLGAVELDLPVPGDPSLAGLVLFAQWLVADAAASAGASLSAGLALSVGA